MPKVDITVIEPRIGVGYPAKFREQTAGRIRLKLGDAGGITDYGVNLTSLPPGKWSSPAALAQPRGRGRLCPRWRAGADRRWRRPSSDRGIALPFPRARAMAIT